MNSTANLSVSITGTLRKKAQKDATYEERFCILTCGIFCYFRTLRKMKSFEEMIEKSEATAKRKAFKEALGQYPPRGFIKLLNHLGKPVSTVELTTHLSFKITHIDSKRQFDLQCLQHSDYTQWISIFQQIDILKYSTANVSNESTDETQDNNLEAENIPNVQNTENSSENVQEFTNELENVEITSISEVTGTHEFESTIGTDDIPDLNILSTIERENLLVQDELEESEHGLVAMNENIAKLELREDELCEETEKLKKLLQEDNNSITNFFDVQSFID